MPWHVRFRPKSVEGFWGLWSVCGVPDVIGQQLKIWNMKASSISISQCFWGVWHFSGNTSLRKGLWHHHHIKAVIASFDLQPCWTCIVGLPYRGETFLNPAQEPVFSNLQHKQNQPRTLRDIPGSCKRSNILLRKALDGKPLFKETLLLAPAWQPSIVSKWKPNSSSTRTVDVECDENVMNMCWKCDGSRDSDMCWWDVSQSLVLLTSGSSDQLLVLVMAPLNHTGNPMVLGSGLLIPYKLKF
jgi:hypothetical protein